MSALPATPAADGGVDLVTFGCRLNAFESEVMRGHASAAGLTHTIIVNTCAVTAEAERQARQAIRRLRRTHPQARIVVTGCAAQIAPERWAAMTEVDQVLGNAEKLRAESWLPASAPTTRIAVAPAADMATPADAATDLSGMASFEGRARAFIEVQNGCDHACTFCIIPQGRGPSRSLPIGVIAERMRRLVAAGWQEIVLTGVDLTAYGPDLPGRPMLGQMLRRVLAQVPELPRLRLSSLDVAEIDDELLRLVAEEKRLMPHLHLSLQSGDDLILKRMKRRHSRAQAVAFCETVRRLRPEITFGADLIAGFPTESDAAFDNTLRLVDDCGLTHLHVFPFSAREHTPAARMPQIPMAERKARAARLRAAGEAKLAACLSALDGTCQRVLVETVAMDAGTAVARGRTESWLPMAVRLADPGSAAPGTGLAARVIGRSADGLSLAGVPA